jgi:REP element-mobilizing transposase RayT
MPDHIHSILQIRYQRIDTTHELVGAKQKINKKLVSDLKKGGTKPGSMSAVIQSFKSSVTRELNQRMMFQGTVWKKGFHDRIIRDENEMERIFSYIENNPYRE